jgi:protein SCO1/2
MVYFGIGAALQKSWIYLLINTLDASNCRRAVSLLLCSICIALASLISACDRQTTVFHATDMTGASFGRLDALDGLTDHTGRRIASADFTGRVVLVFFGYTHCPDICPTTLTTLQQTMQLLGADADRVQVLFVTLDPERDSQEALQAFVPWFDARFKGLRGDASTTQAVAQEFRVFYAKVKGSDALGYSLDHSTASYVFDPRGRLRLMVQHGASPEALAEDIRLLLAGK